MINVISSSRYKISRKRIKQITDEAFTKYNIPSDYIVNIIFIGRIKMKQIAQKYKKEDVALPVLAFPYNLQEAEGKRILGEVFICYPQAVLLAAERNKTVDYILNELIKHGVENLLK